MNAILTWWGVSIAILNHQSLGNAIIARETLIKVVPIFVAVMIWLLRVLIIGTISMAGDRLFNQDQASSAQRSTQTHKNSSRAKRKPAPLTRRPSVKPSPVQARASQPAPKRSSRSAAEHPAIEPTYHPVALSD